LCTASDRCQQEKRKTINGEDILWAMQSLGFENYTEALKAYLVKYRETIKVDRPTAGSSKVKEEEYEQQQQQQQQQQEQQPQAQVQQSLYTEQQPQMTNFYSGNI
jgi:hypothetical protein